MAKLAFHFRLGYIQVVTRSTDAKMQPIIPTTTLMVAWQFLSYAHAKYLLNSFRQEVGGGNFTYYKLTREGTVMLVLETIQGDADLYISDKTSTPDWENFELQAVTCGLDEVVVPVSMKRPVGVGVYGHPAHELSIFDLHVYVSDDGDDGTGHAPYSGRNAGGNRESADGEEEESILWTIFVSILKIILDILV